MRQPGGSTIAELQSKDKMGQLADPRAVAAGGADLRDAHAGDPALIR